MEPPQLSGLVSNSGATRRKCTWHQDPQAIGEVNSPAPQRQGATRTAGPHRSAPGQPRAARQPLHHPMWTTPSRSRPGQGCGVPRCDDTFGRADEGGHPRSEQWRRDRGLPAKVPPGTPAGEEPGTTLTGPTTSSYADAVRHQANSMATLPVSPIVTTIAG